jgi:hypothetical protein
MRHAIGVIMASVLPRCSAGVGCKSRKSINILCSGSLRVQTEDPMVTQVMRSRTDFVPGKQTQNKKQKTKSTVTPLARNQTGLPNHEQTLHAPHCEKMI